MTLESIGNYVEVSTAGCWVWVAGKDSCGYGTIKSAGVKVGAHRWTYEGMVGPIPQGLELDHLCRVRACVNPAHLEPVTHAENMRRSASATKTHCVHGHEFTPGNTYIRPTGARQCRVCQRWAVRRYQSRRTRIPAVTS